MQRAVHHAKQAFEQDVIAGHFGRVVATNTRPREQLHRRARRILHRLLHAEHVVVVDRELDLEGQTGAIVPRQGDRMAVGQRPAGAGPDSVIVRQLHLFAGPGAPPVLDVIGLLLGQRFQQPHVRRIGRQRLAIVGEHQIIQPRAQQADGAPETRRGDLHPRHLLRHLRVRHCRRRRCRCVRRLRLRGLTAGNLRRRLGRLRQMRRDQQLKAEQNGHRDRDRYEQTLLVHHTLVPQSQSGTGS